MRERVKMILNYTYMLIYAYYNKCRYIIIRRKLSLVLISILYEITVNYGPPGTYRFFSIRFSRNR